MVRRNDIVYSKHDSGYSPYGRVTRVFSDGRVETIDCGKYIRVQHPDDPVVVKDYRGKWKWHTPGEEPEHPVFVWMPTLRKLKQMASRYDRTVWKRFRKDGPYCAQTRFMEPHAEHVDEC